ncbi:hypothetical protein ACLK1T_22430 [Escherichia coli]
MACYLQKIAANAKNTQVNYPTGLTSPTPPELTWKMLSMKILRAIIMANEVQLFPINMVDTGY